MTVVEELRPLRKALTEAVETHGRRSTPALQAFEALFRAAVKAGQPLDSLRKHAKDEDERFFAHTIPGPDGHVYWDGAREFRRNDGKVRVPHRWWWAYKNGRELGTYEDLVPTCGETHCINPDHCEVGRGLRRQRLYSDEKIIGALQVAALRRGAQPTQRAWIAERLAPDLRVIRLRFGSWANALRAAGFEPPDAAIYTHSYGAADVVEAIRFCRKRLGRTPQQRDLTNLREELHTAGLPSSPTTIRKAFGSWDAALREAGLAA